MLPIEERSILVGHTCVMDWSSEVYHQSPTHKNNDGCVLFRRRQGLYLPRCFVISTHSLMCILWQKPALPPAVWLEQTRKKLAEANQSQVLDVS